MEQLADTLRRTMGESNLEGLGVILAILLVAFLVLKNLAKLKKRRKRRSSRAGPWTNKPKLSVVGGKSSKKYHDMSDPANQMEAVSLVGFRRKKLLNSSESRLFSMIDEILQKTHADLRLMAQISLGEIIEPVTKDKTKWARAHASVNSKRIDMAICNAQGVLVAAIEFQGSGHYSQKTFMRDAVKKEALRRAGIVLIEIPQKYSLNTVSALLEQHLPADRTTSP